MLRMRRWPVSRGTRVSPIGLDIGPHRVRAAQLERGSGGWKIVRVSGWNRRGAETGAVVSEGFAKRIRASVQQARYHGGRVIAGLSTPDIELHTLDIPDQVDAVAAEKIGLAVRWEMERVISVPAAEAACDYWRLPASKGTNTTAIGAAARKSDVTAAMSLAHAAGLECERIDATSCALSRLGTIIGCGGDQPSVWSALDIGHRALRLTLSVGRTPVLVRTLGDGSHGWTERIAESLGLSQDAADIHKMEHGIEAKASDDPNGPSAEIASMIRAILRPDLDAVVAEIERSYEYVMRCYPDRVAAALLLAGAGSDLAGLDTFLSAQLGIDVYGLNAVVRRPGARLTAAPSIRDSLSAFACAIGLAVDPEALP